MMIDDWIDDIHNNNREVLIEKHWRSVTPRAVCDYFWDEVNKYPDKEVGYDDAMYWVCECNDNV